MYINLKTELLPTGKNAESTFFQVRTGFGNNNGPHAAWNQQSQEGQEPPALKEHPDSCRIFPEASPSPPKGHSPGKSQMSSVSGAPATHAKWGKISNYKGPASGSAFQSLADVRGWQGGHSWPGIGRRWKFTQGVLHQTNHRRS